MGGSRPRLAVSAFLVMLASACGGGADQALFSDESTISTATAPTTITVGAAGGFFDGPHGLRIDVLDGTFPTGSEITMSPVVVQGLPEDATAIGAGFSVTATSGPEAPVVFEFPIPPGTPTDDLVVMRLADDGTLQLIVGTVEDDVYVAAVPGFSEFTLATYDPRALLVALTASTPDGENPSGLRDEYLDLVSGSLDAAAARSVRVIGPDEVAIDSSATFTAIDFMTPTPDFARYEWGAYGPLSVDGDGAIAEVAAVAEGRGIVTVDVTDPRLGVSAFGSKRVFVVSSEDPGLELSPDRTVYNILPFSEAPDLTASVVASPLNLTPPLSYTWITPTGETGSVEGADGPITIVVGVGPEVVVVTVTDANGTTVTSSVGFVVRWDSCDLAYALVGPRSAPVGVPTTFELLSSPNAPPDDLAIAVTPTGSAVLSGTSLTATFGESGMASIRMTGVSGGTPAICQGDFPSGVAWVRVEGESTDPALRFAEAPATGAVGQSLALNLEATGGVLATAEGVQPYVGSIDWGDGTVEDLVIPATSAAADNVLTVAHAYAGAGTFSVTATIHTPDGAEAVATHQIQISAQQVFQGLFPGYRDAESETLHITRNEAVVVVEGGAIRVDLLVVEFEYRYTTFDLQGNTSFADCLGIGSRTLTTAAFAIDGNGAITGTIEMRSIFNDSGSECPFGGTHRDEPLTGTVTGQVTGESLMLDLAVSEPDRPVEHLIVEAAVG